MLQFLINYPEDDDISEFGSRTTFSISTPVEGHEKKKIGRQAYFKQTYQTVHRTTCSQNIPNLVQHTYNVINTVPSTQVYKVLKGLNENMLSDVHRRDHRTKQEKLASVSNSPYSS